MNNMDLDEQIKTITKIYQRIDELGFEDWLQSDPVLPDDYYNSREYQFFLGRLPVPYNNTYAEMVEAEAIQMGDIILTMEIARTKLKKLFRNQASWYETFQDIKENKKANPLLLQWVKDYEEAHPQKGKE